MARSTSKKAARAAKRPDTAPPGRAQAAKSASRPQPADGARARRSAERRAAILEAALKEFAERGFAATRLDDVAKRAGVAKGTIYLHFADKEALFQELIRSELSPVLGTLEHAAHADIPLRVIAEQLVEVFVREVFGTRRKDVIRLVLTEGSRFPTLAEFYHREVLSRAMEAVRGVMRHALQRGEIKDDALVRFPQLLVAPGIVAVLWHGLFDRFEPLDVGAMMRAHFELIFGDRSTP